MLFNKNRDAGNWYFRFAISEYNKGNPRLTKWRTTATVCSEHGYRSIIAIVLVLHSSLVTRTVPSILPAKCNHVKTTYESRVTFREFGKIAFMVDAFRIRLFRTIVKSLWCERFFKWFSLSLSSFFPFLSMQCFMTFVIRRYNHLPMKKKLYSFESSANSWKHRRRCKNSCETCEILALSSIALCHVSIWVLHTDATTRLMFYRMELVYSKMLMRCSPQM